MDPKHYGYNTISEFPSIVPSIYLNPSKLKLWRKPLRSVLKVFLTTYLSIPTKCLIRLYIVCSKNPKRNNRVYFVNWKTKFKDWFSTTKIYISKCTIYIYIHYSRLCVLINMYKILLTYNFKRAVTLFNDQSLL